MTNMDEAQQVDTLPGLQRTQNSSPMVAQALTGAQVVHTPSPFRRSVARYQEAGWRGTIHLPIGQKFPPPVGYTGYDGAWPAADAIGSWSGNIGLRLPDNVIGIDVDHYDTVTRSGKHESKHGANQLADIEARLCELPPTWSSTRRGWGDSRIRFYRVPPGRKWPTKASADIDVIQFGHRYSVVWPSEIDEDGLTYHWYTPDGTVSPTEIPSIDDLAELPQLWVDNPEAWTLSVGKTVSAKSSSWQTKALALLNLGTDDDYRGSNGWVFEIASLLSPAVTSGVLDQEVAEAFAWIANLATDDPHPITRFRETFASAVKADAKNHPDRAAALALQQKTAAKVAPVLGTEVLGGAPSVGTLVSDSESVMDFDEDSGSLRNRTDGRSGYEALLKEAYVDSDGMQHKAEVKLFSDFRIRATAVCTVDGSTTWSVDLFHRDGTVYYDCQISHDILANAGKLKAWFMGYKCSLVYSDRYATEKGTAGDRLMALFHSQNPTDYRITDHLGWDAEAGLFIGDSGTIAPGSDKIERFSSVRPSEKVIEHSRSRYGATVSCDEAIRVFSQILTHHEETVASVVGSWAVLAILRSRVDPQVFPTLVADGPAESGKSKFLQQVLSACGSSGTGGSWTAPTARRALGSNSSGIVWFDDCDEIKGDVQQLLRQSATGGDTANMSAGDSTKLEVTKLLASTVISSEGLGTFFKAQKANRDRMIEVHFPDPKGRRSVKDPARPQWDDIVELWMDRFDGDFTQIAGPLVSAIFARAHLIDEFKGLSKTSSRRSQTNGMLLLGARLLADLTGNDFHIKRVTAWIEEQEDLGNASVTILQVIPTLWRSDGFPETFKDALGKWQNPRFPYPIYWDEDEQAFWVSSAKLADAWRERKDRDARTESLTNEESIRSELANIGCGIGEPKRLGGQRLRYRKIPTQYTDTIRERAQGQ